MIPLTEEALTALEQSYDHPLDLAAGAVAEIRARRKASLRGQVAEFHRMIGAPILETPQVPSDDRVRLRLRLIAEEFVELLESAIGKPSPHHHDAWTLWNLLTSSALHEYINTAPVGVDLPELADALGDLDYVIEGSRLEFGIDGAPVAAEIHRTNMAKADGPTDEHGKRRKPAGWQPPDIAGLLRAQGWKP